MACVVTRVLASMLLMQSIGNSGRWTLMLTFCFKLLTLFSNSSNLITCSLAEEWIIFAFSFSSWAFSQTITSSVPFKVYLNVQHIVPLKQWNVTSHLFSLCQSIHRRIKTTASTSGGVKTMVKYDFIVTTVFIFITMDATFFFFNLSVKVLFLLVVVFVF